MKRIYETIKNNPLFSGIEYGDFENMFHCIEAHVKNYNKGSFVLMAGDRTDYVGLILSGGVKIIKEDMDGNITIIAELGESKLFAEAFACAGIKYSPVTVQASKKSEILLINYNKVIATCSSACKFHSRLIENMLSIIARKNLLLNQKLEVLSKRTTREKLITFFDMQRGMAKKFAIPYNREEMARYLCVDRSAMSKELGKMRDEGLIRFNKNKFELLY